jgi:hypothetical protein
MIDTDTYTREFCVEIKLTDVPVLTPFLETLDSWVYMSIKLVEDNYLVFVKPFVGRVLLVTDIWFGYDLNRTVYIAEIMRPIQQIDEGRRIDL